MAAGEGRGWAKGRAAGTDARIARAAAAHRGMAYERRTPVESCRWSTRRVGGPLTWSPELAYAVGLIATDGCLLERGRQIALVNRDLQVVEAFLDCIGRPGRYRTASTRHGEPIYRVQFTDRTLYNWLLSVGLTPRKSLTLGSIAVPDEFLSHLVRGLLDGDGSVINKVNRADTSRRSDYYWECLRTRFVSASHEHLVWLHQQLRLALGLRGWVEKSKTTSAGNTLYRLAFGKRDSVRLLTWVYSDRQAPCLIRKRSIWDNYCTRHGLWTSSVFAGYDRVRSPSGEIGKNASALGADGVTPLVGSNPTSGTGTD